MQRLVKFGTHPPGHAQYQPLGTTANHSGESERNLNVRETVSRPCCPEPDQHGPQWKRTELAPHRRW